MKGINLHNTFFIIIVLFFAQVNIIPQDKIQEAYADLNSGQFKKAEQLFLKESESSDNVMANYGLYFLNGIEIKNDKTIEYCYKTIKSADKQAPYIFVLTGDEIYLSNVSHKESKIIDLLKNETKNTEDGFINAIACERLGKFYLNHNNFEKSRDYFNQIGAVKTWSLIGPFGNISELGYYHKFGPEIEFNKSAIYSGKDSMKIRWFNINKIGNDNWIDLKSYFQTLNSIFYGNTFLYSPKKQKVQIRIGISGSFRAYLNDHLISQCFDERNTELDAFVCATTLEKGWNRLLLKAGYSDIDKCKFIVRITDDKGFPLNGLKYSTEKKGYNSNADFKAVTLNSPYEKYFEDRIKQHPEYIENYILLSQFYIANENFEKAEELLQKKLKENPGSLMIMYELLSVYRGKRNLTELYNFSDKIWSIKNDIPEVVFMRLMEAEKNNERSKFIGLYERLMSVIPESPEKYEAKSIYYLFKGNRRELLKTINEGYKKYPDVWGIVFLKERLDSYVSSDNTKVLRLISRYCKNNYSYEAYKELADTYLALSDMTKWEDTYNQIIKHNPAEPEYHYQMAKVYFSRRKFDKARRAMLKAIDICPFNSNYYETLGDIYKAQLNISSAVKAYSNSIKYSTTNYSAKRKLKNLGN